MADSRSTIRFEPFIRPIHQNAAESTGATRVPGVADLFPLGMPNLGLQEQPRPAVGVVGRMALPGQRLPVGQTRPVWPRFSLTGLQPDTGYAPVTAPPAGSSGSGSGAPGPGSAGAGYSSGCQDC